MIRCHCEAAVEMYVIDLSWRKCVVENLDLQIRLFLVIHVLAFHSCAFIRFCFDIKTSLQKSKQVPEVINRQSEEDQ